MKKAANRCGLFVDSELQCERYKFDFSAMSSSLASAICFVGADPLAGNSQSSARIDRHHRANQVLAWRIDYRRDSWAWSGQRAFLTMVTAEYGI